MWLIDVETLELKEFPGDETPPYAILSHTWGPDCEELTFRDVKNGNVGNTGVGSVKFHGCCRQAKKDGIGYAWVDTCCIDKTNLVELSEAINSMFRWYKRSSVCYVYLADVPDNDIPRNHGSKFRESRWFGRGWTLQELISPSNLRFYNSEWHELGTKIGLRAVIRGITGIPHRFLLGITELHAASVAQRMSWAARRDTKRKEDVAYCLLGIFGVTMPMIYGEGGDQAFFRLQEQIMKATRDDSILAWGLGVQEPPTSDSGQAISGRILAAGPSDFANSGDIVLHEPSAASLHSLDVSGGYLRIHLPLLITPAGNTIGLLSCGPRQDKQQVVGIPLDKITSGSSDQYARPKGYHSMLRPKTASNPSPKLIHIRNDNRAEPPRGANRQVWLYDDEEFSQVNLSLVDVAPRPCWDKGKALITTKIESDGAMHRTLARLRHDEEGSSDFVIVLEFKKRGTYTEARCCIMICCKKTSLEELAGKFQYMAHNAYGKESASNGLLNLCVTLEHDAHEPMFLIGLEAMPHPPDATVDATAELHKSNLMLEFARTLGESGAEICRLKQAEPQKRWGELWHTDGGGTGVQTLLWWAAENGRADMAKLLLNDGADAAITDKNGRTPLIVASSRGHTDVVRLLLEGGADTAVADKNGRTPLIAASSMGHADIVRLLLKGGADTAVADKNGRTPLIAASSMGHADIVRLLLKGGADTAVADKNGWTPLIAASNRGHNDVARLLLSTSGSDTDSKDNCGRTAPGRAVEKGHKAVRKLPLKKGATAGMHRNTLQEHDGFVTGVAFTPDGRRLQSVWNDNTIQIWDADNFIVWEIPRHGIGAYTVASSLAGQIPVSVFDDKTVRLWDVVISNI